MQEDVDSRSFFLVSSSSCIVCLWWPNRQRKKKGMEDVLTLGWFLYAAARRAVVKVGGWIALHYMFLSPVTSVHVEQNNWL